MGSCVVEREAATATGGGSLLPGSADDRAETIKAVPIANPAAPANEANQILRSMEVSLLGRRRSLDGSVYRTHILANAATTFVAAFAGMRQGSGDKQGTFLAHYRYSFFSFFVSSTKRLIT